MRSLLHTVVAPVAMECIVKQIIPCGNGPIAANLVIGEVVRLHIGETILDGKGGVDRANSRRWLD